jgi:hypothetical protein
MLVFVCRRIEHQFASPDKIIPELKIFLFKIDDVTCNSFIVEAFPKISGFLEKSVMKGCHIMAAQTYMELTDATDDKP